MSKNQALVCAAIPAAIVVCILIFLPPVGYGCALPFLLAALIFSALAYAKHKRDAKIIVDARQEQVVASQQLPVLPPMTSRGSSRLFVPPPLQ